ncbi:carboxymuconolactone decarboxylase family protein [Acidobacteria bacterium AH-259-O06]|nr:carboxymuconolactone decarboxylase family protein [Acidobacteria bacterium AH-259-O06]
MAWIETVDPEKAQGALKREYEAAIARAGKVYNIVKLSSLRPDILRSWVDFYVLLMHREGQLSRRQREMIAVVVSAANDCSY